MTVVCISPSLTVRQGVPTPKPVAHSTSSHTSKVSFSQKVRIRRTVVPPRTSEEFQAIWFTEKEILERRRKDKRLRYAVAKQPEVFGTHKLLSLGLYTESERLQRCKRAVAARDSVLTNKRKAMDVDSSGSDSDDSSLTSTPTIPTMTFTSYALHSKAAAVEAHERALQHSKHVQSMDNNEDDASAKKTQEFSDTTSSSTRETASQALPSMDIISTSNLVSSPPIGVRVAA
ncbi:unnamed protein product [Cylindrotheca closterium]|uniref:Uncharacterized protein n=1 Tax=Cylindrotheca closterium TaxID=2856 RepID=A0AAD2CXK3_9STRA|nr:unnamed protein product [Cylindrotheca closterium]